MRYPLLAILICSFLSGCLIVETGVTNPMPEMATIAVAPFMNLSAERSADGREVAIAYYTELQKVPGYQVIPVGVVEQALVDYQINLNNPDDALKLAKILGADAIVVGAITEFTPYYPPRIGMQVSWYAPQAGLFVPGLPLDPEMYHNLKMQPYDSGCKKSYWCKMLNWMQTTVPLEIRAQSEDPPRLHPNGKADLSSVVVGNSATQIGTARTPSLVTRETGTTTWDAMLSQPVVGANYSGSALSVPTIQQVQAQETAEKFEPPTFPQPVTAEQPSPAKEIMLPSPAKALVEPAPLEIAPVPGPALPEGILVEQAPTEIVTSDSSGHEVKEVPVPEEEPKQVMSEPAKPQSPPATEHKSTSFPKVNEVTIGQQPLMIPESVPSPQMQPWVSEGMIPSGMPMWEQPGFAVAHDPRKPVMSYTRIFDGADADLTAALRDYVELSGDLRSGSWEAYLHRTEDFIKFTSYRMILEMLTLHGGEARRRYVLKYRRDP
ncbi:hypothetical protein [Calycomorphotria hydatis]|uniref:Uncharacterized protein n=1 Tax=Calycomorphotria hydatis TaxID=2528027 RepID=A0A517TCA5_9PLAN|nr:hypothetical protein [Calycomorphotria hydatis]QDT65997.1 hypothetical protein V22_32610 [Calycomorphotria hydatis]